MPKYQFFNLKVKRIIESEVSVFLCVSLVFLAWLNGRKKSLNITVEKIGENN